MECGRNWTAGRCGEGGAFPWISLSVHIECVPSPAGVRLSSVGVTKVCTARLPWGAAPHSW